MNDTDVSVPAPSLGRTAERTGAAGRTPSGEFASIGRPTPQRTVVLEALMGSEGFVSAQILHAGLLTGGSRVGLSTVYRTLTALADAGRADVVRDVNGERLFRYRPGADHRHYLICRVCGLSVAVDSGPVETWADQVAEESGFADVRHTVELAGVCTTCLAAADDGRPAH
ncbi:Fur family transcriptional regulator [Kitasatospora sp. NPDC052896]|uniref:Fur family transcriptional regulator n=1 Tax=Kitasatospora sp. NPDC052896 TaxID=3364061 RepID=UPI0037CC1B8B